MTYMFVWSEHVVYSDMSRVESDADEVGVRGVHVYTHDPTVSLEGELRVAGVLQTVAQNQTLPLLQEVV